MKPTPRGWPRISSSLYYFDALSAIDWLVEAFGFEVRLKIVAEDGKLAHSELTYGDGLVMVGEAGRSTRRSNIRAPSEVGGGNTQNMMVYVDDADAHCERARAAGATIIAEPKTVDYGPEYWSDRGYECRDVGGHHWYFYQRLRDPS